MKEGSGPSPEKKEEKEEEGNAEQQSEEGKGGLGGKKRYLLYSCGGDGNILEFDPTKPNKFPKNINLHIGSANASTEVKVYNLIVLCSRVYLHHFLPFTLKCRLTTLFAHQERPTFPKRSDFAWKKDGTLLAVGNSNGCARAFAAAATPANSFLTFSILCCTLERSNSSSTRRGAVCVSSAIIGSSSTG